MTLGADVGVVIVGGGPAGLLLSYVLFGAGIDNVILERRSRKYVEARIRAGQLDYDTTQYLVDVGIGERLRAQGIPQRGLSLSFDNRLYRIDLEALTQGRYCTIYGQAELTRDLIRHHVEAKGSLLFEAEVVEIVDADEQAPGVVFRHQDEEHRLRAKFVVGCDGYFGITRKTIERIFGPGIECAMPYAWYGIFTETPPISKELSYAYHRNGFALCSMRTEKLSRIYLQCSPSDRVEDWDDSRFWDELFVRIGPERASSFDVGKTIERTVVRMRGYMARSLRYRHVLLAGDAAHVVPPSAAKGLNLAVADVRHLADAMTDYLCKGSAAGLNTYSEVALKRAWEMQDFSCFMTDLLHSPAEASAFFDQLKLSRLHSLVNTPDQLSQFANRYVGQRL